MEKLKTLFQEWQKLQPLKLEYQEKLNKKLSLEFNYNSNHIEGNTLTYGQTKLLFIFGEIRGNAKMRDLEEMKAHNAGLKRVLQIAKETTRPLTEIDIRDINKVILVENFWKTNPKNNSRYEIHVGEYKTRPNSVITSTGEEFNYALPEETSAMMGDLMAWLKEELKTNKMHPIEIASLLHYRYIRIHPFDDGNGRIARLLTTYILERFGYPMIVIKSEEKEEYLRILHQCDVNVGSLPSDGANATLTQIKPFVEYMKHQLEWSLNIAIKAGKGESVEEPRDFDKKIANLKNNLSNKFVPKSSESVKAVVDEIIFPMALKIEKKLNGFKDLFDSYDVNATQKSSRKRSIVENSIALQKNFNPPPQFNSIERLQRESIFETKKDCFELNEHTIFFNFKRFRYNGESTFNFTFWIRFKFTINNYEIYNKMLDEKLINEYNKPMSEQEMGEFVDKIADAVLKDVTEQATNNSNSQKQ